MRIPELKYRAEKYYVAFPAPGYEVDHVPSAVTPHKNSLT